MTPFSYPKSAHVRRLKPGPFTTYQKYKPFLRDEFEKKCVYCRMPDTMKDPQMYGADHYRPKSIFPQLATKYENLFYCCNPCNQRKRDYWPTWRKVKTHFIPNPCDHAMFAHLRFTEERVEPRTAAGRFTHELLDLDGPDVLQYRRFIMNTIELYERQRRELLAIRAELRRPGAGGLSPIELAEFVAANDADLAAVDKNLARLQGG